MVPGIAHHVTQQGNQCQQVFHCEEDYALYLDLMSERCRHNGVEAWAYCLMPNHVHLILVPTTVEGLSRAIGEAHRRYTAFINARARVTGHLFQSRFNSVAMDEPHLLAAIRYVAMTPVEARLTRRPEEWSWSSVRAHLSGRDDALVTVAPIQARIPDFAAFLEGAPDIQRVSRLLSGQTIGRPLMSDEALHALEQSIGRRLRVLPRGPKPKAGPAAG